MSNPTLYFPWLNTWWRAGGSVAVEGTIVDFKAAGGVTAVSENMARPIETDEYMVSICYRSTVPVEVLWNTTMFANLGGTGSKNDSPRRSVNLPASTSTNTVSFPILVTHPSYKSFRPVFRFNAPITLEYIAVRPAEKSPLVSSVTTSSTEDNPLIAITKKPAWAIAAAVSTNSIKPQLSGSWVRTVNSSFGPDGPYKAVVGVRPIYNGDELKVRVKNSDASMLIVLEPGLEPTIASGFTSNPSVGIGRGDALSLSVAINNPLVPDIYWDPGSYVAGGSSTKLSWCSMRMWGTKLGFPKPRVDNLYWYDINLTRTDQRVALYHKAGAIIGPVNAALYKDGKEW